MKASEMDLLALFGVKGNSPPSGPESGAASATMVGSSPDTFNWTSPTFDTTQLGVFPGENIDQELLGFFRGQSTAVDLGINTDWEALMGGFA